ncbi:MAG: hypothetical protein LBJ12_09585, partial [Oscillospiraceae bacterium]|nr:hypothetical protein [Oscillospiraceae bacterium]
CSVPSPQTNYITIKRRLLSPLSLLFVLTRSGRMEIIMKKIRIPSQNPNALMNNRPNNHVDLNTSQTPKPSPSYPSKPSDILCVPSVHIKHKGCAGRRLERRALC